MTLQAALPIMVVDDNQLICQLLAKRLSLLGYRTDIAYDGCAALKLIETEAYGLAISDYEMPGMNGIELFRCMRRVQPDLPGLLVTGHSKADVEKLAIEAGIHHVLPKPTRF